MLGLLPLRWFRPECSRGAQSSTRVSKQDGRVEYDRIITAVAPKFPRAPSLYGKALPTSKQCPKV